MIRKAIYTTEQESDLLTRGSEWNFHEEETKQHLHSIHPYPAKFIPQIPRKAISLWTQTGDFIYDPFSGCGTTAFEASLSNRHAIGTDNNAVANLAARAKTNVYNGEDIAYLEEFLSHIRERLERAPLRNDLIPTNKNFHYWFNPLVTAKLASLKGLILAESDPIKTLLMAVFSSIVVKVSFQDSDTRYSKIEREVTPEHVPLHFARRLSQVIKQLKELPTSSRGDVAIKQADARSVKFIDDNSVNLIVTSPPYLNAYDYHKYHRQRLHWIGGDESVQFARDLEIGSHDKFTKKNATPDGYFEDMNKCFHEWLAY